MHFLRAYSYLGSQSKLSSIGKCSRYVHVDAGSIGQLLEQTAVIGVLCNYALAVM